MRRRPLQLNLSRGVSLIELMVAITLGMIVLAAVSTVFLSSRVNYTTQESMARLQESARIAAHFLISDLRLAGYYGCIDSSSDVEITLNEVPSPFRGFHSGYSFNYGAPIEGFDNASTVWYPSKYTAAASGIADRLPGTDALLLRMGDWLAPARLATVMPSGSASLQTTGSANLRVGDVAIIADCEKAAIFQVTGPGATGDEITNVIRHMADDSQTPGNARRDLGKPYEDLGATKIMRFVQRVYYVKTNGSGKPALYRQDLGGGNPQELVEGIADLQILYGVDTDDTPDGVANKYVSANDSALGTDWVNWANIVSVRLDLEAQAVEAGSKVENKTFSSTVKVRNLKVAP